MHSTYNSSPFISSHLISYHHIRILPPKLQMRHNNRPILRRRRKRAITLNHEIHRETQPTNPSIRQLRLVRPIRGSRDSIRVIRHDGDVIAPSHELLELAGRAAGVRVEDLHHVFLGVAELVGRGPLPVDGDVVRPVAVQHFEDVLRGGGGDDGRGYDLVHGFVVAGVGWVVD